MDRQFDHRHIRRCVVVGDIHGTPATFRRLATAAGFDRHYRTDDQTTLVSVGDIIDRGPGSLHMLLLAMCLGFPEPDGHVRMVTVQGNHEYKAARALRARRTAARPGLQVTLDQVYAAAAIVDRSPDGPTATAGLAHLLGPLDPALGEWLPALLTGMTGEDFIETCASWLDGLPTQAVLDDGRLVVAHAGLLPHLHGRRSRTAAQQAMYGITGKAKDGSRTRADFPTAYEAARHNGVVVACGHYHQVTHTDHTHVLDSDACKGDGLTGLHWPDRRTVKVDTAPDDLQLSCSAGVVAA